MYTEQNVHSYIHAEIVYLMSLYQVINRCVRACIHTKTGIQNERSREYIFKEYTLILINAFV